MTTEPLKIKRWLLAAILILVMNTDLVNNAVLRGPHVDALITGLVALGGSGG